MHDHCFSYIGESLLKIESDGHQVSKVEGFVGVMQFPLLLVESNITEVDGDGMLFDVFCCVCIFKILHDKEERNTEEVCTCLIYWCM